MFRVRLIKGGYGWVSPACIQAVMPGPELATTVLVMRDGANIGIAGVADEIGLGVAKMIAGLEPMFDASEKLPGGN